MIRVVQQVVLTLGSEAIRYDAGDEQGVLDALPGMVEGGFDAADAAILGQWLTRQIELREAKRNGATQA